MSDDPDRQGFTPRAGIEYVVNKGKLEVVADQVITVSPEPLQPTPEQRAADAEAAAKMKMPKDAGPLVIPVMPPPSRPEPAAAEPAAAAHAPRRSGSHSDDAA